MKLEAINWKAARTGLRSLVKRAVGATYRAEAERAWAMSAGDFWRHQAHALADMYGFARARVPYYADRPDLYPRRLHVENGPLAALADLPILDKATVRAHNAQLWPTPELPLTSEHTTSGTSGTPLRLHATLLDRSRGHAILQSWYRRICGTPNPRTLSLSGFMTPSPDARELSWRDPLTGDRFLSIYSLAPRHREAVARLIERDRPQLVYGYSSAVHELAALLGDRLRDSAAERAVVVTSEVLQPGWREDIERNLGRVHDLYSSQEGCHVAIECEAQRLHIHPHVGVVEILDEHGDPTPAGEVGRVVVTGLLRRGMPLIRYDLGDLAESTDYASECTCGLGWPQIGRVGGRAEDLVRTPDGRSVGLLCFHSTKDQRGIREAQLIQRGFDRFVFNLVRQPGEATTPDLEARILEQLSGRLGYVPSVEFRYLDQIPRGARGKFKAVVVEFDA